MDIIIHNWPIKTQCQLTSWTYERVQLVIGYEGMMSVTFMIWHEGMLSIMDAVENMTFMMLRMFLCMIHRVSVTCGV